MAPKGLLKQDEMQIFIIYKEARLFQKKIGSYILCLLQFVKPCFMPLHADIKIEKSGIEIPLMSFFIPIYL